MLSLATLLQYILQINFITVHSLLQYILQSFKELARICEISKNNYFTEHLWATSSINKSTVEYL